jgi:hypothetical protein
MKQPPQLTQHQHFWHAQMMQASELHKKMAELQRKAGNERLARDSEHTALARRISARNLHGFKGFDAIGAALEFGELMVRKNIPMTTEEYEE